MDILKKNNKSYIEIKDNGIEVYFSTAEDGLDYSKNCEEGLGNLEALKEEFNVSDVAYLHQIHSDIIKVYPEKKVEGDALISTEKNIAIGAFTADCVPVIIYDKVRKVSAAIHSGWKGTYYKIVEKTIDRMIEDYGCTKENLYVVIGPHILKCCYEVSEELIDKFNGVSIYKDKVSEGRMLDLMECILLQLQNKGISSENISTINECTCCGNRKMHSYRRDGANSGRMFSFIITR